MKLGTVLFLLHIRFVSLKKKKKRELFLLRASEIHYPSFVSHFVRMKSEKSIVMRRLSSENTERFLMGFFKGIRGVENTCPWVARGNGNAAHAKVMIKNRVSFML